MKSGKIKLISIVLGVFVLCIWSDVCVGEDLQIHLPREIAVSDSVVTVGSIGVLSGDQEILDSVADVPLGKVVNSREGIVIDRNTILSRLADNDVSQSNVSFTGAEQVTVTVDSTIVSGEEVISFAKSFLAKQGLPKSLHSMNPRRVPEDILLTGFHGDVTKEGVLLRSGSRSQAKVRVVVKSEGIVKGKLDVVFNLNFNCRVAVATKHIEAGDVITIDNITIEDTVSNTPQENNWRAPLGYVAKRNLVEGTQIRDYMLEEVQPSVIIERNQTVVIKVESSGFLITAMGKAMEAGRRGELIKVRNADSQRIIVAEVNSDGTVRPVL